MEDILEVYQRPKDPRRPLVCLDETTKQLVADIREPIPLEPGKVERHDYEYRREGVGTLFMLSAPLMGWRKVMVTERKTRVDYACVLKKLSDDFFPQAEKIVLVQDNLNTHNLASLYEAFQPQEARRLAQRFEIHYTPKHGSWLNIAEIELSVLASQCLNRRIPNRQALKEQVKQWAQKRNQQNKQIKWRFTTKQARIKLKRLYPNFTTLFNE